MLLLACPFITKPVADWVSRRLAGNTGIQQELQISLLTNIRMESVPSPESLAGCGKTRFAAGAVPKNCLVSTAQPDKKKVCEDKTSSSWMCSAT